jgi:hypothetical protein
MPSETSKPSDPVHEDGKMREDVAVPRASDEEVLAETARLAREGQREQEQGQRSGGSDKP